MSYTNSVLFGEKREKGGYRGKRGGGKGKGGKGTHLILVKLTGLIITTMKLNAQFALVLNAFAGARIFNGTISAGYNHVMPNQPTAKKVLKTNKNNACTIPGPLPPR